MRRQYISPRGWLFVGMTAVLGAVSYAQAPSRTRSLILAADEGDPLGSHYVKADPQTGSMRLGVGLQRLKGRGIPIHIHEKEDEILFVHSGSGLGIVGDQRRDVVAGTTLYIPQGTWHGIDPRSDELEVLWVVSPPYFAQNLRTIDAKLARNGKVSPLQQYSIGRQHGIRDYPTVVLARVGVIAALLAVVAAVLVLVNRGHAFRTAAIYLIGVTLATALTMLAIGRALIPPVVLAISTLLIVAGGVAGAVAGIGTLSVMRRAHTQTDTTRPQS
jgi:mannose-6-phosphate isomerase-like protein (cupin superfamily)